MTEPTAEHRRRYRRYVDLLGAMCDAYEVLEAAQSEATRIRARGMMQDYARRVSLTQPPAPWRSWCELGYAIHGRPSRGRGRPVRTGAVHA
jgi:hypothetical protein